MSVICVLAREHTAPLFTPTHAHSHTYIHSHGILPPLHADFYSATSMSRMLEDKGVLCQWDDWRCNFVAFCKKNELHAGPYVKMPKLLPFLVSGYDTARKKRCNTERPRMPEHKGGGECGKVLNIHIFILHAYINVYVHVYMYLCTYIQINI